MQHFAVIEARGGGRREGGTHVSDNYLNQYYSMKRPNDGLGSGGLGPFGTNLSISCALLVVSALVVSALSIVFLSISCALLVVSALVVSAF